MEITKKMCPDWLKLGKSDSKYMRLTSASLFGGMRRKGDGTPKGVTE